MNKSLMLDSSGFFPNRTIFSDALVCLEEESQCDNPAVRETVVGAVAPEFLFHGGSLHYRQHVRGRRSFSMRR